MERTKGNATPPAEGKVHWKKVGGGSFMMGKRIIKPGESFWAFPHEIPKAFRDVVIALDTDVIFNEEKKDKEPVKKVEVKEPTFIVERREGSPWCDVYRVLIDEEGKEVKKKINEKGLTEEKAEKFKNDLLKK